VSGAAISEKDGMKVRKKIAIPKNGGILLFVVQASPQLLSS